MRSALSLIKGLRIGPDISAGISSSKSRVAGIQTVSLQTGRAKPFDHLPIVEFQADLRRWSGLGGISIILLHHSDVRAPPEDV